MSGNSVWQGTHQVAKKLSTTTLPLFCATRSLMSFGSTDFNSISPVARARAGGSLTSSNTTPAIHNDRIAFTKILPDCGLFDADYHTEFRGVKSCTPSRHGDQGRPRLPYARG